MVLPGGDDLEYLSTGSPVQAEVYELLKRYRFFEILKEFDPILAGTVPLDIQIPGSDLDIICEVHDFASFERYITVHFGEFPGFSIARRTVDGVERLKANFICEYWPVELFGQPIPTRMQNAYRHMLVEARLLKLFRDDFKQRIIKLKCSGLKTEPAFAHLLQLNGDPYQQLLTMENLTDEMLLRMTILTEEHNE